MALEAQNIFITKKQKLQCKECGKAVSEGELFVAEAEKYKGTCFSCSPFVNYTFLPPGNAALTRRSKKQSLNCGVVLAWSQRRRRYERQGQYVEAEAIEKAQAECNQDAMARAVKNKKAAELRIIQDKEYVQSFGKAIRKHYPNCPKQREFEIAQHACEKYSGRVGRTADAKKFDTLMIDLAVEAHIRHVETNYDLQFGKGRLKKEIRADLSLTIKSILASWK